MASTRSFMSGVVGTLAVAVCVAGLGSPAPASTPETARVPVKDQNAISVGSSTEVPGPMAAARASGHRVEDPAQRDEFTRVYANPDGSWTSESASEPESAQDDNGTWHDIDTSVVARDGALEPKYAAADLRISDGGDKVFAAMTQDGKDLEWRWPTVLPTPVVDGDTVTYPGVAAGGVGDLVVTTNAAGFSYDVVLREQPTAPVDVVVPVATDGATLKETADGSLTVTTKAGDALVTAAPPVMYDAQTNADGDPSNVVPVDTTVSKSATGPSKLTLSPDEDFLADPDTIYPVTVDPTFTSGASDGWIQTPDYTSMQGSGEELRVGTKDGGTHKARTFMHFGDGGRNTWAGTIIDSASLVLRNFDSYTCTSGAIRASRLLVPWGAFEGAGSLTWANQPSGSSEISTTDDVTFSSAYGGPTASCSSGDDATWNVTAMVRVWAANINTDHGIRLAAVDETANNTYRRYRSANYTTNTALRPRLIVNWHTLPGVAQKPDVYPTTSYTPPGGTAAAYTQWSKPLVSSTTTDWDGGTGVIVFRFYPAGSSDWYTNCTASYGETPTFSNCYPTDPLPDGTYTVRAKAGDNYGWAGGGTLDSGSGWSPPTTFTVAAAVPAPPQISCGSDFEDGTWVDDPPAAGLSCTATAPGIGFSAPSRIYWSIDGGTETYTDITPSSNPDVAKATTTLPNTPGLHTVQARAKSPSGLVSTSTSFSIGYGATDAAADSDLPAMTSYGVDSYELADLQLMATEEGTTLQKAVDLYGWTDSFAGDVEQIAAAYPGAFSYAEVTSSGNTPGATVHFTSSVPTGVAGILSDLPVAVATTTGAPYTETEMTELLDTVSDEIVAQYGASAEATVSFDDSKTKVLATVYPGASTASQPSASVMRSEARAAVEETLPSVTLPNVEVTISDVPVYELTKAQGGGSIKTDPYWDKQLGKEVVARCTTAFPARTKDDGQVGMLTAAHCNDGMYYYKPDWDSNRDGVIDDFGWSWTFLDASRVLSKPPSSDTLLGDVQFQPYRGTDDGVGKRFYVKRKATRRLTGMGHRVTKGSPVWMFGRTTDAERKGKVLDPSAVLVTKELGKIRLATLSGWLVQEGDSGGPVYRGGKALGLISGYGYDNHGNPVTYISQIQDITRDRYFGGGMDVELNY